MTLSIAFVGAGPTTLYTLAALLAQPRPDYRVTVFEEQATAGLGAPYRPGWNDPAMLSNIASIEIPPLTESLLSWMRRQPPFDLQALGMDVETLDERTFVPRVLLGQYFRDQFDTLVARGRAAGIPIEIHTGCRVIDAADAADGMQLTVAPVGGPVRQTTFDHVVLATGHQWPSAQQVRPGYFLSPWPATALSSIPATSIGIRGSSLTAIDTAVVLAGRQGAFVRSGERLDYRPAPATEGFGMTMMSRKGLLPEADFFFPLPYAPLSICTPEAIAQLIRDAAPDLLEAAFELFRREMLLADPAYSAAKGLHDATLESFSKAYFAERAAANPFDWAQANLVEARQNHAAQVTVPWRYAILRMHEVIAAIVPHLDRAQFARFSRHFKPVFVDDYGAVPHESIERMLALHRAGKLEVFALGDDYHIDTHVPQGGAELQRGTDRRHFPIFIEAMGQRPLSALQFPFLTLLEQGVVRDEDCAEGPGDSRGIVIDANFHPIVNEAPMESLFCLSLPFIMGRHPFVQGITSSHDMGETVGAALASLIERAARSSASRIAEEAA